MVKVLCTLCQVFYSSFRSLSQHVMGQKHRTLVAYRSKEELEQVGRLQYLINTQMKGWAILGLEYVVERKSDTSYIYTCTLCHVVQNCHEMVGHITDVEHMQKYIYTHHRDLHDATEYPKRVSHLQALQKVARMICKKFGNKQICVDSSACSQNLDTEAGLSSEEGGNKNCTLPSVGDDLQTKNKQEGPTNNAGKQKLEHSKSNNPNCFYFCNLCAVICATPLILCQHLFGIKHQKKMLCTEPKQVKELESLSFLLHTYLQEVPILGLEYILELKEGSLYRFSCLLCGMEGNVQKMVAHILDVQHTELYIKKHHGNLLPPNEPGLKKRIRVKALQGIAKNILKSYGRKEIMVKNITVHDSTVVKPFPGGDTKTPKASEDNKGDMTLYHNQSSSKRRLSPCNESNSQTEMLKKSEIDGPSLAKRSRLLPEDDKDALPCISGCNDPHLVHNESQLWMTSAYVPGLEYTTAEQELEFRTNDQLLDYLANFVIKDDEDAAFIHKISKNCIMALKCFNEEEAEKLKLMQKPQAPFAHISGTSQETPNITVSKTESHSSGSKAFPKDASSPSGISRHEATNISKAAVPERALNPPLGIPKNEATNISKASLPKHASSLPLGIPHKEATDFSKASLPKHASNPAFRVPQSKAAHISKATLPKHELNPPLGTPQYKATDFSKVNIPKHTSNSSLGISQNKSTDVSKVTLPKPALNPSLGNPQNKATDFSTLPKQTSKPPLGIPQNEATDFFFSTIKNMSESEVVAIFEKIATMNPEFQGMNIPTVIRFLKETGRLKKS